MSDKHYNINYLENTASFLKDLKEASYEPFKNITQGTVVDLGCGTGLDVINMADILGENVKLIGIDHDPLMIEKARSSVNNRKNTQFLISEVSDIDLESDTVSGLRAERLVQHLKNPEKVMKEIYRVLKDEHPLAIIETDWPGLIFYNQNIDFSNKLSLYLTNVQVNNGFAARKLPYYLKTAGFKNISMRVFPFVLYSLAEANRYLWIEHILNDAVNKNYFVEEEKNKFVTALKIADEEGYFACCLNMLIINGIK